MRFWLTVLFICIQNFVHAQPAAHHWADSVYNSLSAEERIAQLMVVRLSTLNRDGSVTYHDKQVLDWVQQYNVGGVLIFQGGPYRQANMINVLNEAAKTPIMYSIDGEWGVAQRLFDSVMALPKPMMLGAMSDPEILYRYGKVVADQCKRLGIHLNYAPVADVNNNPKNPVINDRSFGENKEKVAAFALRYMQGMQDNGVMACAKHFPGHGDVTVDSHYDLPVINKQLQQLKQLELFPFQKMIEAGVASMMVAHLYIPAIEPEKNRATTLSPKAVKGLLRETLNYDGLIITDALEMQGVQKFFPGSQAAVEALIAGNDVLCLPGDVPAVVKGIQEAIRKKKLTWEEIEDRCKRLLRAKYNYVLPNSGRINKWNIAEDLNKGVAELRREVAESAVTLLRRTDSLLTETDTRKRTAFVGIGISEDNNFASLWKQHHLSDNYFLSLTSNTSAAISRVQNVLKNYDRVVIGIHNLKRTPGGNFGVSREVAEFVQRNQQNPKAVICVFGNAYAAANWCGAQNLVLSYEDDSITHQVTYELLREKMPFKGSLPVKVCEELPAGAGINTTEEFLKKKIMRR